MSTFAVTIRKIESVVRHPNADKLDVCRVKGLDYQFVYARDVLKPNDLVVYFPIDSLITSESLIEKMGLTGKLSGSKQNRVKTITLRGEISQGVVVPYRVLFPNQDIPEGEDVTEYLPVEKYIPPENPCHCGNLIGLPDGISKYDIEGCDNHIGVVEDMMDMVVCVTEKVEGTNFSITYTVENDEIRVNQHSGSIIEVPSKGKENTFWKTARKEGLIEVAKNYCKIHNVKTVTLFGELIGEGIQKNIYKLKGQHVLFYDIKEDYKWVNASCKWGKMFSAGLKMTQIVPILSSDCTLREWLKGKGIKEASHGYSRLNPDVLREGVVITPFTERYHHEIGRLILKQRDPIYLSKNNI